MAATVAGLSILGGIALPAPPGITVLSLFGPTRPAPPRSFDTVTAWLGTRPTPPDPHDTTPAEVAAFFARIRPDESRELTRRFPEIVGDLDGVPTALRYSANQARQSTFAGRQILAFDDRADGRVVEVFGDLDTAARVVVIVPGVDTTRGNFDSGLGGVQRRSPSWQARQLFERVRAEHPTADIAVVAWLGYDPPEGLSRDVLREDRAAAGAESLNLFVDGLLTRAPTPSIVVVGHSYGSTVAGLAVLHASRQVTDLVALGSPGMGVDTRSALPGNVRVWACTAPGDWVRRVPGMRLLGVGHGRHPSDPEFGAQPLPCDDVEGHDGYFVSGTTALQALADIAADNPEGVLR